MVLKADRIADRLRKGESEEDPFALCPSPDLDEFERSGSAAVDLHLGTWFAIPRQTRKGFIDVADTTDQGQIMRQRYVRFGDSFFLHPQSFALAVTLEWVRFPRNLAGYVIGKSSWGRRGLIIATATGVHPGFTGCITLELTNVGEVPIVISPGAAICQLFLHTVDGADDIDQTRLAGHRKPVLGKVTLDSLAVALSQADK